jgi:Amt family ammonium transporter
MIGKRHKSDAGEKMEPHDVPMVVLGAGILWFGWFGFNAGSAVAADGRAAMALMVSTVAAAAGMISWVGVQYLRTKKVSAVGAAAGAVAGLVAVTPASGFVGVGGALVIGLVVGGLSYTAAGVLRERIHVDDALDVFAVHGVGGMWGALATGIFAVAAIGGVGGLIEGNPQQLLNQLVAVVATVLFAAAGTFVIMKIINLAFGVRVPDEHEEIGLDLAIHGEAAYQA